MKRTLLSFVAVLLCSFWLSAAQAQTTTPAKASTTTGPTKKNGTPDMRYKANKDAATKPAPVHTKKDGTADMRYKENKATTTTPTQPKTTKTNASTKKPAPTTTPAKSGK